MVSVVFGSVPRQIVDMADRVSLSVEWQGTDGSVWELTDPSRGAFLMMEEVEGLHFPAFTEWASSSPSIAGQMFRGQVAEPRQVKLPVFVDIGGPTGARDRAFWRAFQPGKYGTLTVTTPDGRKRSLVARPRVQDPHAYSRDPFNAGWATYIVELMADEPFWTGSLISQTWEAPPPQDFYEQAGPHLINISSGFRFDSATIPNPGDEAAWPVWKIHGPCTSAHVGVGSSKVSAPFSIAAGRVLTIDTDPRVQEAIEANANGSNPVDRMEQLGTVDFAEVLPGESVQLNINLTGTGVISAEFKPRYWRAW